MAKPSKDKRVQHLLSKLLQVRQKYMDKIISVEYLSTDKMIADYLTKPIYLNDYSTIVAKALGITVIITT